MAGPHFLMISERGEDLEFGEFLSRTNGMTFHLASTRDQVRYVLTDFPQCVVFWDATSKDALAIAEVLAACISPSRVFAITDETLKSYPHLFKTRAFGHHLLRRYHDPAPLILSKLVGAAVTPNPFGLLRYFPEDTKSTTISLKKSGQKTAAVEAIQNVLIKQSVPPRIAALAAKSADELMMNALFDAPTDAKGQFTKRRTLRDSDFDLSLREQVEVEIASSQSYFGIRVADQFGSFKKETMLGFLARDYQEESYLLSRVSDKQDKGAGLGIYGMTQSGISVLFVCKPGVRTEVMMFFEKTQDFKSFRSSFRFLSIIGD